MKRTNHSVKFARQRRFLLVLPLLTLPFITLMFWAFGGGKGNSAMAGPNVHAGINLKLPDAKLKDDKALTKLSFYQQAALDSAKTREAEKLDPYWGKLSGDSNHAINNLNDYGLEANKAKVYDKLDELKKVLDNAEQTSKYSRQLNAGEHVPISYSSARDIDRLQTSMQQIQTNGTEDPEITQLNAMLDKIQVIQNPDKVSYVTRQSNDKSFAVKTKKVKADISLLKSNNTTTLTYDTIIQSDQHNAFYGLANSDVVNDSLQNNSIECLVPETQTIVAGSTVKLVLSNDVTINDMSLPSGTLVYGTASISNERLKIAIASIRYENSILPVSLNIYDLDGQEGIFIPGSISTTVAKESANKTIGSMDATLVDPSIGAQAASAGIEAAKTLVGKKVKLIKVTIKSGYKVLLKDSKEK